MAELWTIGKILKWTEQYFAEKNIDSPRLDAEVLLSHVLKKERIYLYVHFDEPLEAPELKAYRELVKGRVQHVPVAYLTGCREFMGLSFHVTPAVLIPRPETEILVQAAIEELRKKQEENLSFADIGTGSGAICLSVLHYVPGTRADTVDISPAARNVAEGNAAAMGLSGRVEFHTGDLLEPLKGKQYHAILSNPPYIPDGEIATLAPEVRSEEPRTALAGGKDGLEFYRRLAASVPDYLLDGGFAACEVGIHQEESVKTLFAARGMQRVETLNDLAGIPRVVMAWKE